MDLFDLWPTHFNWYDVVFRLGSMVTGLFLLLLAGLTFTQLFRQPRPARFLLAAIGLTLTATWGIDRGFELVIAILNATGSLGNNWGYFGLRGAVTILGLLLSAATWWCLMLAVFDPGGQHAGAGNSPEEPA